ncbi:MAG: four helix bundle protein [Taibaiella sp.]|nr:four helix bundle protein [Taibaiella sp.]
MKTNNVIQHKTFAFAVRVVNLYKYLNAKLDEKVLSKQLLRCGTSIGANIEEAIGGQSERDFYAKLTISYKEAREARYWIKLLKETLYLSEQEANSLLVDIEEICKIIGSIQKAIKFRNT